jgi:hypothetical protein
MKDNMARMAKDKLCRRPGKLSRDHVLWPPLRHWFGADVPPADSTRM